MANRKGHIITGAVIGLGAYAAWKYLHKEEIKFSGAVSSLLVGGFFGLLPDILEPALNPNHRSVFHSVTALAGMTYVGSKVISSSLDRKTQSGMTVILASYASHLLLDLMTPKGLPVLHNGRVG